MTENYNYLLVIDPNSQYNNNILQKKLDLCIDWIRLFACTYMLHTTSKKEKLYSRFKGALPDNKFFITQIDISNGEYTGWLGESRWNKIRKFKNM